MKSRMNNTNVQTLNVCTRTVLVYKLYFLLLQNKISLQSVGSLNRTFFFSPSSFSVVLRSNHWSNGIFSMGAMIILPEISYKSDKSIQEWIKVLVWQFNKNSGLQLNIICVIYKTKKYSEKTSILVEVGNQPVNGVWNFYANTFLEDSSY